MIREGYAATRLEAVLDSWLPILPERTLVLDDIRRIAELIVSTIAINEGRDTGHAPGFAPGHGRATSGGIVARALTAFGRRPARHDFI